MHPRTLPVLRLVVVLLSVFVVSGGLRSANATEAAPAGEAVWPLTPVPDVVAGFDPPRSRWGAGHRGVDLAGTPGQRVRAARTGTITFAGTLAGRGVVVVDHGATRTTYEPVAATVGVGDRVVAGDPLGTLQRGGSHCFPAACLHWGLREGDTYLDPLTLVGAGPVRLLPLGAHPSVVVVAGTIGRPVPGSFPAWARTVVPPVSTPMPPPRGEAALFRSR